MAKNKQQLDDTLPSEYYNKRLADRTPYETRAKNISSITLPYVFRDVSANQTTAYADSIQQSFCGRLVNTLTSKLTMGILPPSASPFKLVIDNNALVEAGYDPGMIAEVNLLISQATNTINSEIEKQQIRNTLFDINLQNIIAGSIIMEKVKNNGIKIHTLRSFVADLDSRGEMFGMCIVETLKKLPDGIEPKEEKEEYELYTMCIYDKQAKKWVMTQELEKEIVNTIEYTEKKFPFQHIGFRWVPGDKYHRPYAEDYYNDMVQYNTLSEVLTQGSVVASKSLIFVDQRGNRTRKEDVVDSRNGDVVDGNAADVTSFQLGKNFDFQVPLERLTDIGKNLAQAFMMAEGITRNAERVTAEEIRVMAQELEQSNLSGVYTKMTSQFTKKIVEWVMQELGIEFKEISAHIVTGLDALGRSAENQKFMAFIQSMMGLGLIDKLNIDEVVSRMAGYENINTNNLLKSAQQIQTEQEQAMQQSMMAQGANSIGSKAGDMLTNAMAQQQQQQQPEQQQPEQQQQQ
jgi:hypothetical protein